jgi:hypothetical protein
VTVVIDYFTGFYGPVLGMVVMGVIGVCLGAIAGLVARDIKDRRKP